MLNSYQDPTNHSVPILDIFADTKDDSISYIVMPFLRLVDEPPFYAIEEILNFASQILEVLHLSRCPKSNLFDLEFLQGLVFMHSKGVAHRYFIYIPVEDTPHASSAEIAPRRTF